MLHIIYYKGQLKVSNDEKKKNTQNSNVEVESRGLVILNSVETLSRNMLMQDYMSVVVSMYKNFGNNSFEIANSEKELRSKNLEEKILHRRRNYLFKD